MPLLNKALGKTVIAHLAGTPNGAFGGATRLATRQRQAALRLKRTNGDPETANMESTATRAGSGGRQHNDRRPDCVFHQRAAAGPLEDLTTAAAPPTTAKSISQPPRSWLMAGRLWLQTIGQCSMKEP
jgi:hypothetical protein